MISKKKINIIGNKTQSIGLITHWDRLKTQKDSSKEKLSKIIVKPNMVIVDMGCGSSWLLDFLLELEIPFDYVGLDFNKMFIKHLNKKYKSLPNVQFVTVDFEDKIPKELLNKADIVLIYLLFENANLDSAFENGVKMLKKKESW